MEDEEKDSEELKSRKEKISKGISPAYKNPKLFLGIFLIGIPALFFPVSHLPPDWSHAFFIIMTIVIGIFVFLNQRTIWLVLKGSDNLNALDYQNALIVIRKTPKISAISAIILIGSFAGLLSLPHIPTDSIISEFIRTIILILFLPSIVAAAFSTIHIFGQHPIKRNNDLDLSKAWIMSIEPENTDSEKMNAIIESIEYYDTFLVKSLNLKINNLNLFYEKFTLEIIKDSDIIIDKIKEKFKNEQKVFSFLEYLQIFKQKNIDVETPLLIEPSKGIKLSINVEILRIVGVSIATIIGIIINSQFPDLFKIP